MSANRILSREVIGTFYEALEGASQAPWLDRVARRFESDQAKEEYPFLGFVQRMSKFTGTRDAEDFPEDTITLFNEVYHANHKVSVDDMRRDKTGQLRIRMAELADAANDHDPEIVTDLLQAGESATGAYGAAYDGEAFFDTDHVWGNSGTYSNDITLDVTTPTAPTAAEIKTAVLNAIQKLKTFKDNQGRPMNRGAQRFTVLHPTNMWAAAEEAFMNPIILEAGESATNTLRSIQSVSIEHFENPWFTVNDRIYVFRTDGRVSAIIRQVEKDPMIMALAEGSEYEHINRKQLYTVEGIKQVGFGYPQYACLTTLT